MQKKRRSFDSQCSEEAVRCGQDDGFGDEGPPAPEVPDAHPISINSHLRETLGQLRKCDTWMGTESA